MRYFDTATLVRPLPAPARFSSPAGPSRFLRRALAIRWLLAMLWVLTAALTAHAQAPAVVVRVSPAGPLVLYSGSNTMLTATAVRPDFNAVGVGFNGSVRAVVVQPDGKMLVGGEFTAYNGNAAAPDGVLRLNADGSLDASFNPSGTGIATTANNAGFVPSVNALALQPDGKVLIGGMLNTYNGNAAAPDGVLRLNADGSLDTSFNAGGAGANNYSWMGPGGVLVDALALQPNGQVLVGGVIVIYNGAISAATSTVIRLNANGSLDTSFTNRGVSGQSQRVRAMVLQPDGKLLVAGSFVNNTATGLVAPHGIVRLTADGSLDTSFNANGTGVRAYNGNTADVRAVALQPDGKVLVGGNMESYNGNAAAPNGVLRLNADGSLDTSFNTYGAGLDRTYLRDAVHVLALQPNGKILVGGNVGMYNGSTVVPGNLCRLEADGSLDATFNAGGKGLGGPANQVFAYALALQPDGQVLVGGAFNSYNDEATAPDQLLRLGADGILGTPVAGATFVFNPGATLGSTRSINATGTYTATATDPATGNTYTSLPVLVTLPFGITSLSPTSGPPGSSISVTGSELTGVDYMVFTPVNPSSIVSASSFATVVSFTNVASVVHPVLTPGLYMVRASKFSGQSNALPFTVTLPTAAQAEKSAAELLYPNPAQDHAVLHLSDTNRPHLVRLFDALGREISRQELPANATKAELDLRGLSPGLYVVHDGVRTARLAVE